MKINQVRTMLFQRGYTLLGELGRGGQAQVYLVRKAGATQTAGEYQACKVGKQGQLEAEAYLLKSLKHPCFPRYYGYLQWGSCGVLFMEYICGSTLEEWLGETRIPFAVAEEWCVSLWEALNHLHDMPEVWIYRDLKPANVVIRQDGRLKLVDMGGVCPVSEVAESIAGTPGYCAPEQLSAPEQVGTYSDYYSLGKVINQLLIRSKRRNMREWWRYLIWRRLAKGCMRSEMWRREMYREQYLKIVKNKQVQRENANTKRQRAQ